MNIALPRPRARVPYWFAVPFVVMALLFVVTDLLAMRHVRQLRAEADNVVQDMLTDIDLVSQMRGDINRSRVLAGRHILETSSAAMVTIEGQLGQTRADFAAAAAQYEAMPMLPLEEHTWMRLKTTFAELQPRFDEMIARSRANDQKAAREMFVEMEGPFDRVDSDLRELIDVNHVEAQNTVDELAKLQRRSATLQQVFALSGFALSLLLGAVVARALHVQGQRLRRSGERLAAERARLATILTSAPHGIVFVDALDGRVETNPAAEAMTGYPATGQHVDDARGNLLFRPDGTSIPRNEWPGQRALRGDSVSRVEVLISRNDGSRLPVIISATPVRGPGQRVIGAVLAFEDITVFKELERLRDEFASIVAHDLRNPISSILMNAEWLRRQPADAIEPRAAGIERICRAAERLGGMVKDLLDASRIEVDRLRLDRKPLAPRATVEAIVEEVRPTLGEHPVKVAAEGEPAPILADPLRFGQILTNLLENAAKYSPRDAPIDVKVVSAEGGVEVSVKDEGMGIAPEEIPRLFDRFYQAKRAREMKAGFGLGLYITRGLVTAHGGRIWVDSQHEHGSTFHVWLPCGHGPAASAN